MPDTTAPMPPTERIPFEQLRATLARIFERHGTSAEVAAVLADNCAAAERDGAHSHGVFRIPGYLSTLASGWVDGRAVPQVQDLAPGAIAVDARNGFAQPAYAAARGSQRLHAWLLAHPRLGPPVHRWRDHGAVPRRAKWAASIMMVGSAVVLQWFGGIALWVRIAVPVMMACVAVWLWLRPDA